MLVYIFPHSKLTHLFPMHPFYTPWKHQRRSALITNGLIRKWEAKYSFLDFWQGSQYVSEPCKENPFNFSKTVTAGSYYERVYFQSLINKILL